MVFDAIQRMADENVGALMVLQNDRVLGIITERDYTRKVILKHRSSKETPVSEIMETDLACAAPGDSVDDCLRIMTDKRIRHLPVMENGKLVGIVSIGDLVKWIISAQRAVVEHLEAYIFGASPG
jgi:signal-transduction protein with cAMP-binding, CBS, and nucleotidyltransferase domain